jgi:hypothetical protein
MPYSVRNGEQIIRQYNPIISNPRSTGQVAARVKMKLLSQLSAIVAAIVAIPRDGAKSPRNLFTQLNYGLVSVEEGVGSIELDKLQITKSTTPMTAITATRTGQTGINVALSDDASASLEGVVYVLIDVDANKVIRVKGSTQVTTAGTGGTFAGTLPATSNSAVVLAYGISKLNQKARVAFGNIEGDAAEHVAELVTSRTLTATDMKLTETVGVELAAA